MMYFLNIILIGSQYWYYSVNIDRFENSCWMRLSSCTAIYLCWYINCLYIVRDNRNVHAMYPAFVAYMINICLNILVINESCVVYGFMINFWYHTNCEKFIFPYWCSSFYTWIVDQLQNKLS